jgi:hypothetical protein
MAFLLSVEVPVEGVILLFSLDAKGKINAV